MKEESKAKGNDLPLPFILSKEFVQTHMHTQEAPQIFRPSM
jgi:hypothetical protein